MQDVGGEAVPMAPRVCTRHIALYVFNFMSYVSVLLALGTSHVLLLPPNAQGVCQTNTRVSYIYIIYLSRHVVPILLALSVSYLHPHHHHHHHLLLLLLQQFSNAQMLNASPQDISYFYCYLCLHFYAVLDSCH